MFSITPPVPPLCKVLFTPGAGWSTTTPITFLTTEFDTHGMFSPDRNTSLKIPLSGLYSILMNVNYAESGVSLESEWGINVMPTPTFVQWNDNPGIILRCYTGFGAYNGQYAETIVNLRANDFIAPALLPGGRSTNLFSSTNPGKTRYSHMIVQYISPSVPNRGANGTTYDFR